jgi:ABC-type dipeptide/oligopeptide/nickel transport system permease component
LLFYIAKRILYLIPALIVLTILVFSILHLTPGDPALAILGEHASKESIDKVRKELGLDKPLYVQYLIFLKRISKGDFGKSIKSDRPVLKEFSERFSATFELAIMSMVFAIIFGIAAGVISATYRYSIFDYATMSLSVAGLSIPVFWFGLILIYFFAVKLGILPVSGRLSYEYYIENITGFYLIDSLLTKDYGAFIDALKHIIMPAFVLSSIPASIIARITRSSMIDVLKEEYIKTAYAKGCSRARVVLVHALKNAMIPVITVIGLMLGSLLAGAILTETTFSWPGIGKWIVNAVYERDFPIIQGATIIIAVIFMLLNLAVDIIYTFLNPRITLNK